MNDNAMTINLQAPVFNSKEEEWLEFKVKFQAFLAMKGCTEAIQTNFKSKLPARKDKELDASTELEKAKILAKMENAMAIVYVTLCLNGMAMLNEIFNVQVEAGWLTGKACELFNNLKQKYNRNDKLSRVQMIKKPNKIKPMKGDDPKVMCNKIEALKVKHQD